MKKVMLFLMVCCLIGLMQADLAITNGDFEDQSLGALDIVDWWDSDGADWWNTASNTQAPEPFPDNSGFLGDSWPSDGGGRWMYQQIGTKEANTGYTLSFEYAQPTDGAATRAVSIQVDIYQGNFAGAAQDVDIADQGLTLIDSFTAPFISDVGVGVTHEFSSELDLTLANTTDPLWLRLSNPPGQGTGTDAWVCVDNVEIASQTLKFMYNSPANNATNRAVEVASTENDLTWTVIDPNIVKVDVYFGAENDPNLTLDPQGLGYKVIDGMDVVPGEYTYNPSVELEYLTDYYWKVIGYEPNEMGGLDQVPGPVWTFRTINDQPTVDPVDPVFQAVPAGQNAVLTVVGENVVDYQWYKVGDANPLTDGADYSGTTSDTLTVLDVQLADEASFYCVGTNFAGSDSSIDDETGEGAGRVMVQRLTSHWPLDTDNADIVDGNDVQVDIEDGYDMVLASNDAQGPPYDAGLDYPTPDPNVVSSLVGDESLWFKNDNPDDPNNGFRQYALVEPAVAEFADITISCWVYWGGGGAWQRILDFGDGTNEYMFLTPNAGGGNLRFVISENGGASGEQQVQDDEPLPIGQWTYVTVTLNGDTARLYVNGELAPTPDFDPEEVQTATNTNFTNNPYAVNMAVNYIADSQYGGDPYFNGLIDDLKIYNYALTTEQIAQDYLDVQGEYICNREVEQLIYDFNEDCRTNLEDFAMFVIEWMDSNRIYPD